LFCSSFIIRFDLKTDYENDDDIIQSRYIYVQYIAWYVYYINIEQYLNVSFTLRKFESIERNWDFATNSDFLIPLSLQPNVADIQYLKRWVTLDQIFIDSNFCK